MAPGDLGELQPLVEKSMEGIMIICGWGLVLMCVKREVSMNGIDLSPRFKLTIRGWRNRGTLMQGSHNVNGIDSTLKSESSSDDMYLANNLPTFV